jgi:hypothetical protein
MQGEAESPAVYCSLWLFCVVLFFKYVLDGIGESEKGGIFR